MRRERPAVRIRPVLLLLPVVLVSFIRTGSGPAATLPPCSAGLYGIQLQVLPKTESRQPTVLVTGGWMADIDGRRSCVLDTTMTLSIADSGGMTAAGDWHVHAVLHPWGYIVHTWAWRNWCGASGDGEVTVALSSTSGSTPDQGVPVPPTCVDGRSPSTVTDVGTGQKYVQRHGDRLAPHIFSTDVPPPIHEAWIKVKNGWIVSDGYQTVVVYAGSRGNVPSLGRFAIVHQNDIFGVQYYPPDIVDVGRVGPVRITRAPTGASHETTAQRGTISFVAKNGTRGTLDLYTDRVRIRRGRRR